MIFDNFDAAKSHMRSELTKMISPYREHFFNLIFDSSSSGFEDEEPNSFEEDENFGGSEDSIEDNSDENDSNFLINMFE